MQLLEHRLPSLKLAALRARDRAHEEPRRFLALRGASRRTTGKLAARAIASRAKAIDRHVAPHRLVVEAQRERRVGLERARMRERDLAVGELEPAADRLLARAAPRRRRGAADDHSRACARIARACR